MLYPSASAWSTSAMPGPASRATTWTAAAAGSVHQLDDRPRRIGEPHDVAGDLGDRRGDQGQVGRGEAGPGGELARRLSRRHDVGVGRDRRSAPSSSRAVPAVQQRHAQPRAQVALQQVAGRVDLSLPAPVTAGQREQHRSAPVGRRLDVLQGQQVLHPQPGPGAVQLRGHRARRWSQLRGQRAGVLTGHLVGEQGVALPLQSAGQGAR